MKLFGCIFWMICPVLIFAQKFRPDDKSGWRYSSLLQGGLIAGANQCTYTIQTIHGFERNKLMAGIGIGMDNYLMPGFPVVAHGQYQLGKKASRFFSYLQGGPVIPWRKNEWNENILENPRFQLKTGWLAETGIGYQIPVGKHKIFTSIGYSIKQSRFGELIAVWIGPWPPTGAWEPVYTKQELIARRWIFKAGIAF